MTPVYEAELSVQWECECGALGIVRYSPEETELEVSVRLDEAHAIQSPNCPHKFIWVQQVSSYPD